jgi:hypothetical protein
MDHYKAWFLVVVIGQASIGRRNGISVSRMSHAVVLVAH